MKRFSFFQQLSTFIIVGSLFSPIIVFAVSPSSTTVIQKQTQDTQLQSSIEKVTQIIDTTVNQFTQEKQRITTDSTFSASLKNELVTDTDATISALLQQRQAIASAKNTQEIQNIQNQTKQLLLARKSRLQQKKQTLEGQTQEQMNTVQSLGNQLVTAIDTQRTQHSTNISAEQSQHLKTVLNTFTIQLSTISNTNQSAQERVQRIQQLRTHLTTVISVYTELFSI